MTTLPPGPSTPRLMQAVAALTKPGRGFSRARERYGDAFTINSPLFGRALVISDAGEIKQLFQAGADIADNLEPNLGRVLGPGSLFALAGDEHRKQRKLLVPPFHGRRLAAYEQIMEQETLREFADLAAEPAVRDPAVDDADHHQHHPAHGVRGRGRGVRTAA